MAEVILERAAAGQAAESSVVRFWREHRSAIRGALSFIIVGIVWEWAGRAKVAPMILTPLSSSFDAAVKLWEAGQLQRHITTSLNEFFWGFLLAAAVGILVGVFIATSETFRDFVDPWVSALFSTPTVALAPLFIIIFGIDVASKIAVVFLLAVFPIVINTATGIRSTEKVYIDAARSFCASRQQIFTKILIPSALPFIVAGLRLGIGRGLVGVVVGELFGARAGLGYLVLTSSQLFDTPSLWVGIFILAGTGILSVVVLQKVEKRMAPWREFELQ